jgi:hypothetical protein
MSATRVGHAWSLAALLALAAFAVPLTTTSAAHAEPSPAAVDEGRALFSKGVTLFRAGDFRAALEQFTRAYAVAPSFRIQFNIGQTCSELQDHACATKAFELFLADGGKQVPPAQRIIAERELKRLHALVGSVRVVVNVAGADVTVDDAPVGTSPISAALTVNAGRRKISASKPPLAPVSSVVDVPGGDMVDVSLTLADASGTPLLPSAPDTTPSRTPFWIGVSATGVLVVATVVLGVVTLGAKSDLDATVGRFGATADDISRARSKVDGLALATDVFGGAAIVAAGITTYFFFTTKPTATQVGLGPGGISLRRAF